MFEGIRAYWDDEEQQLYGFKLKEHYERLLQSVKHYIWIYLYSTELCDWTVDLLKKNNFKTTYIRPVVYGVYRHLLAYMETMIIGFDILSSS